MALKTAGDLIAFALRAGGIVGVGQTPAAEDSNDGLTMLNMLLSEWQVNRWLVPDLTEAFVVATGAASYTVGAAGAFVLSYGGARPERIDGAFARLISTGADTALFPFISKQGYDRVAAKTAVGPPESYFYDAQQGASGVVYFTPVPPATWELHVQGVARPVRGPNRTSVDAAAGLYPGADVESRGEHPADLRQARRPVGFRARGRVAARHRQRGRPAGPGAAAGAIATGRRV